MSVYSLLKIHYNKLTIIGQVEFKENNHPVLTLIFSQNGVIFEVSSRIPMSVFILSFDALVSNFAFV